MTRETAIEWLDDIKNITENWSQEVAIDMAIEALAERPTGEWVKKTLLKDTVYDLHVYKCSCCGVWGKLKFNYCPNCGAKMRGIKSVNY